MAQAYMTGRDVAERGALDPAEETPNFSKARRSHDDLVGNVLDGRKRNPC